MVHHRISQSEKKVTLDLQNGFGYYRRFHRLHDQYFGRKTYGIDNVVYIEEVIKCDNRVLHHLISIKPIASRSALVKSYKSNSILSIAIAFSFEYLV